MKHILGHRHRALRETCLRIKTVTWNLNSDENGLDDIPLASAGGSKVIAYVTVFYNIYHLECVNFFLVRPGCKVG